MYIIHFDHIYPKSYPSDFSLTLPTFPSQNNRLSLFPFLKYSLDPLGVPYMCMGTGAWVDFQGLHFSRFSLPQQPSLVNSSWDTARISWALLIYMLGVWLTWSCARIAHVVPAAVSSCLANTISRNIHFLWLLQLFSPFFWYDPWALEEEGVMWMSHFQLRTPYSLRLCTLTVQVFVLITLCSKKKKESLSDKVWEVSSCLFSL